MVGFVHNHPDRPFVMEELLPDNHVKIYYDPKWV